MTNPVDFDDISDDGMLHVLRGAQQGHAFSLSKPSTTLGREGGSIRLQTSSALPLIAMASFILFGCNKQKTNPPVSNPPLKLPSPDSDSIVKKKPASPKEKKQDQRITEVRKTLRSLLEAIEAKNQKKINYLTTAYGRETISKFYAYEGTRLRFWQKVVNGQARAKWIVGKSTIQAESDKGTLIFVRESHWKLKEYGLPFD